MKNEINEDEFGTPPLTPSTAPRNAEGLGKLGIFQLQLLAQACGGLSKETEKVAFARMSTEQKSSYVLILLDAWDRKNGFGAVHSSIAALASRIRPKLRKKVKSLLLQMKKLNVTPERAIKIIEELEEEGL